MSQQLTNELFLAGAKFRYGTLNTVYTFIKNTDGRLYHGRIDMKLGSIDAHEGSVCAMDDETFTIYALVCGELVTVVCRYENYNLAGVEEKEVSNV